MESRKDFSERFANALELRGWRYIFERDPLCKQAPYNPVGYIYEHDSEEGRGTHRIDGEYTASNRLKLLLEGRADARWMTWAQAERLGHTINPNAAKGVDLEHWQFSEERPIVKDNGEPALDSDGNPVFGEVPLANPKLVTFTVFNGWDITGLESDEIQVLPDNIKTIDKLVKSFGFELSESADEMFVGTKDDRFAHKLGEISHLLGTAIVEKLGIKDNCDLCARLIGVSLESSLGHDLNCVADVGWSAQADLIRKDHNAIYRAARDADKALTWAFNPELRPEIERSFEPKYSLAKNKNGQEEVIVSFKGLHIKSELADHLKEIEKSFAVEANIKSGLMLVPDQERLDGILTMRQCGFEAVKEEGGIDNTLAIEKVFAEAGECEILKNNIEHIIGEFYLIRMYGGEGYKLKNEGLGWEINDNGVPNDDAHRCFSDHFERLHMYADKTRDPVFFERIELMKNLVVDYENLQRKVLGIEKDLEPRKQTAFDLKRNDKDRCTVFNL